MAKIFTEVKVEEMDEHNGCVILLHRKANPYLIKIGSERCEYEEFAYEEMVEILEFIKRNGEKIKIGFSRQVREELGFLFDVINEAKDINKEFFELCRKKEDEIKKMEKYENMNFKDRFLFLIGKKA